MHPPAAQRYLRAWSLTEDGPGFATPTSWLLPVRWRGRPAMLKLHKPGSDEHAAANVLRWFAGNGAVDLLAAHDAALLMERADCAVSLRTMAIAGDDLPAADILADCVTRLHAPRAGPAPSGTTPLQHWFRSLRRRRTQMPLLARCADVASRLLADQRDVTVLHGDLHHDNVLHSTRGWLAIDPKGLVGERSYEVANLLGNPWPCSVLVHDPGRMLRLAHRYATQLGLDPQRVLGFALAHAGLSASWSMDDGGDPAYRLTCAAFLDPLIGALR